jgi:acid stress-induced BolA-like protein IbaG/YrbA
VLSAEKLQNVLLGLGLREARATVEGEPGHWVAYVISPGFQGEAEADRQARVWGHLLAKLSEFEIAEIEFVFTATPGEDAALAAAAG